MFKTVSVRRKKLRIRIGDKEGLLNSYIINSTSTNLHLICNLTCIQYTIELIVIEESSNSKRVLIFRVLDC